MLLRIDNIFYNTPDVRKLANYYSQLLSLPIRRMQYEGTGINWMEINVGGMELSFRRFEGTEEVHPELKMGFLEILPGNGATISFEVKNIEDVIAELKGRGVEFVTEIIKCTDGMELISIFKDPFGKPVQLYEAKFDAFTAAEAGSRNGAAFANMEDSFVASNRRNFQGLALSVAMQVPDIETARHFYVEILGLNEVEKSDDILILEIDGSKIELRSTQKSKLMHNEGANIAIEVLSLPGALSKLKVAKFPINLVSASFDLIEDFDILEGGLPRYGDIKRGILSDMEGNKIEIWEK